MITQRADGDSYNAALKHAAKVNAQLNKKAPSAIEAHSQVSVKEALEQGITHSKSESDHHRENLKRFAGYFNAVAEAIPGSITLNNMPNFQAMGLKPHQVTSAMMEYNRKWILKVLRSGRER